MFMLDIIYLCQLVYIIFTALLPWQQSKQCPKYLQMQASMQAGMYVYDVDLKVVELGRRWLSYFIVAVTTQNPVCFQYSKLVKCFTIYLRLLILLYLTW